VIDPRLKKLKTGLGPGQWLDPPKPPKQPPTLTERVCNAISKGRDHAQVAGMIGNDQDLELTDDTIKVLRERLSREIYDRQRLSAALKGVLDSELSDKNNRPGDQHQDGRRPLDKATPSPESESI